MKFKTLLASVAIFACASSANAADVIKHHIKKPAHIAQIIVAPMMPVAPSSHWVGPYLGFETGTVINKFHATPQDVIFTDLLVKPKEQPLVGLFAGYNIAIGRHAILGLDGNIDYHATESFSNIAGPYVKYKESALAAARLRLGFTQDRFMPYIAGGLSLARANFNVVSNALRLRATNKQNTYIGWNIGGGIDYALAQNVFLRADYRFSRIKLKDIYEIDVNNNLRHQNINIARKSHELRIGAAYKF